jgi:hypothetical protein
MRLIVPYLLILLLVSAACLSADSVFYAMMATLQVLGWGAAIVGLRYENLLPHRIAAPASALLVLNAAAIVGLYKFLSTRGPLWKIWKSGVADTKAPIRITENGPLPAANTRSVSNENLTNSNNDLKQPLEQLPL